jgi:hypothetical protein
MSRRTMCSGCKLSSDTHHLYFAGHPNQFAEAFHTPDLTLDPRVQPLFVLSSRTLALAEKPVPSLPTR